MENSKFERLLQKLLWLYAFFLGVTLLYASLNVFLADSELWALSSSRHFWSTDPLSFALHYKPAFHAVLNLFHHADLGPGHMPLAARYLFAILGLVQVSLLYILSQRFFKDRTASLLTIVLYMTTSFFLLRGFRIRSDYLATTFFLLSLTCLTSVRWNRGWLGKAGFTACVLLMLASTPKAIYLLLLLTLLLIFQLRKDPVMWRKLSVATGGALLLAMALVIFVPWLRQSYQMSLDFFLSTFHHPDQPPYFSQESFKYVTRLLKENLHVIVLITINLYFCIKPPTWSKNLKAIRWMSALTLIPLIFHNHRTTFFILSLLPPLFIFAGKDFKEVFLTSKRPALRYSLVMIVLLALTGYRIYGVAREGQSNAQQIQYLTDLVPFLKDLQQRGTTILDVGGAIAHKSARLAYLGPSDDNARNSLLYFLDVNKPEWILDSYRLSLFGGDPITDLIADNYVRLPGGLWYRADRIDLGEKETQMSVEDFLGKFDIPDGDEVHLIFQTSGPSDSSTTLRFRSNNLTFPYHAPLPLKLIFQADSVLLRGTPKVVFAPLPFPANYALDSYSLFYFDTLR